MGAQVTFESRAWQVTGLVDGRVHLIAGDGATGCVLAAHLVSAPGFSVTGPTAAGPPARWPEVGNDPVCGGLGDPE